MKAIFNQGIGIFPNAFSNEWCDHIIKIFEDNQKLHKSRKESENTTPIHKDDMSTFLQHIDIESSNNFIDEFYKKIYPIYSTKYFGLDQGDFHTIKELKVQKTLPSQGYHIWHHEDGGLSSSFRKAVYTVYLNDVKEGGETEFLYQSLRVPPKKGTVCIFPAGYYHQHRGNPPLSGKKYILTGWLELNKEQ
tara:strand:- start:93 stop:665 length:573 start_codon:yes stop_codon:yes gene_type:complete